MQFSGIYVPVITPFRADYSIDEESYAAMIDHLIGLGVHGIVIGGTTGENYALTAEERIHQFDEKRTFAPWFYRVVVNDARKLAVKQAREEPLEPDPDPATVRFARWLSEPDANPEQLLEQKEASQIILKAVKSLPPGQRASIVIRYCLDMSMAEMSSETGRPLSTIKWCLRDARRRLHRLLAISRSG